MFEFSMIALFGVGCAAGGYLLATHIHSVASAAASATTRATTLSGGDVAALNTKMDGLGTELAKVTAAVGTVAASAAAKV